MKALKFIRKQDKIIKESSEYKKKAQSTRRKTKLQIKPEVKEKAQSKKVSKAKKKTQITRKSPKYTFKDECTKRKPRVQNESPEHRQKAPSAIFRKFQFQEESPRLQKKAPPPKKKNTTRKPKVATTRSLYVVCIYGAICLQILFLKHHILLFCHEILKNFA